MYLSTLILFLVITIPLQSQNNSHLVNALRSGKIQSLSINEEIYTTEYVSTSVTYQKLDPSLRIVLQHSPMLAKTSEIELPDYSAFPFAISSDESGTIWVDVMLDVDQGFNARQLSMYNVRNLLQVGSVISMIAPLDRIEEIARDNNVRFIEMGAKRQPLNSAGRVSIGADKVHDGIELPKAFKGEGVIVGVIDSGIDFTHPDFNDANGTRLQFLTEYTTTGQLEWTKQQIDSNPAAVTQRDTDEGHGHGSHVTGTAAGGGKYNAQYSGMAPNSDIIFVKGFIEGGFPDNAVIGGCQYIFSKAALLGKPAVINLSLGSNWGPMDGSSLYEQALSNLTGPGKIIVAAAGNEGFELIHAGAQLPAAKTNMTILLTDNPAQAFVNLWYKPNVISHVAVGAFILDEEKELVYLGNTDYVPVGSFRDYTAFKYEEYTLGYIGVDAQTISDPRNGDGNIVIGLQGDPNNGVNLDQIIWVILYYSNTAGTFDMWSFGGWFWNSALGIQDVNEVPGDSYSTIGSPATAQKIIAVGSYVTTNTWTNIDGQTLQWQNPDPTRQTNQMVVPLIGQKSYFSSLGPTRDGRIAPDISAPGELVFSVLSSHLNEGQGYQRALVLQGGKYLGMQGTSMASPHVTGVVALMLQANPTLTYQEILQVFTETARTDSWTGSVPNNLFGAGKIHAHAAVKQVAGDTPDPGDPTVLRHFDPQTAQKVWVLDKSFPIDSGFVFGTNFYYDKAKATAYTLPAGKTEGKITQIKVWFAYKRPGLINQSYSISIFNGTAATGPIGLPIVSDQFLLKDVNADDNLSTEENPTLYTYYNPVSVGQNFFVAVDFGAYQSSDIGNGAIVATEMLGRRVPEVWEQWDNGLWYNLSDEWFSQSGGNNGWHMWMEVTLQGTVSVPDDDKTLPTVLRLEQNYPNPFNPVTKIRYSLPEGGHVSLIVYDILGRVIETLVDSEMDAGTHTVQFDGNRLSSGLYFYRLKTGEHTIIRRMTLVR